MKKDDMKHDKCKDDKMMHDGNAKTLERASPRHRCTALRARAPVLYQEEDGKAVLEADELQTSNGPDVHVILVARRRTGVVMMTNFLRATRRDGNWGRMKRQ